MSARKWKPGDVARVRYGAVDEVALVRQRPAACHALEFAYVSSGFDMVDDLPPNADVRPLVVIDPEDEDTLRDLRRAYERKAVDITGGIRYVTAEEAVDALQAALREFANPTPPKPPEPQGLGAVVEDAEGKRWTRGRDRANHWTRQDGYYESGRRGPWFRYDEIDAVKVLSEGVPA